MEKAVDLFGQGRNEVINVNFFAELKNLFAADGKYVAGGKLLKNTLIEMALKLDKDLIKLLLTSEKIKNYFFVEIEGVLVFDKDKFIKFIDSKEFLPDSYTAFKNKIGLTTDDGKYISRSREVVLAWPFKDCVLAGGQKEADEKRQEIFYNEILAPDEIDRLLEPKVFSNIKRIDKDGEHEVAEIKPNDNFIIKGNNLLVLHSLKKRFANKVKLIYIDPPYNTGNDDFKYNDSFTHSTWLTFMKNRLETARELLKDDGVIFIQISNSPSTLNESPELGYLLVLMDEIFGRKNYITTLVWKKKGNPGNTESLIGTITESIIMYAKDIDKVELNLLEYKRVYRYKDEKGEFNLEQPVKTDEGSYKRDTMKYSVVDPATGRVYFPPQGKRWTIGAATMRKLIQEGKIEFIDGKVYQKKYREDYVRGDAKLYSNLLDRHGSLKTAKDELVALGFDRECFDSPKPEILIKSLLDIVINDENEIVLDFFLGSGTTCAVAHKMGLQYIGVEQMEYINSLTVERMKKVIRGEAGGISSAVGWQGGGDFVYMELMKLNELYVEKIMDAADAEELLKIWEELKDSVFINYKVDPRLFEANLDEFKAMDLDSQRKILVEVLEKNELYVSMSEIEDSIYQIDDRVKKLCYSFYQTESYE